MTLLFWFCYTSTNFLSLWYEKFILAFSRTSLDLATSYSSRLNSRHIYWSQWKSWDYNSSCCIRLRVSFSCIIYVFYFVLWTTTWVHYKLVTSEMCSIRNCWGLFTWNLHHVDKLSCCRCLDYASPCLT